MVKLRTSNKLDSKYFEFVSEFFTKKCNEYSSGFDAVFNLEKVEKGTKSKILLNSETMWSFYSMVLILAEGHLRSYNAGDFEEYCSQFKNRKGEVVPATLDTYIDFREPNITEANLIADFRRSVEKIKNIGQKIPEQVYKAEDVNQFVSSFLTHLYKDVKNNIDGSHVDQLINYFNKSSDCLMNIINYAKNNQINNEKDELTR